MNFEKKRVSLSAIRPSGTNPRDDMGDLDALADAIRATGNEPVNPPVVVQDGNVYRIVDGERRYRALKKIWKLNTNQEVTVLVADGMDDAAELVAMLATDDKKPLTDAERGHGVQQMLILGVDEQRVARASRATPEQMAAARASAPMVPEGAQVSLDQMVAAMQFEADEDREAVLSAGTAWYSTVSRIKSARRAAKRDAEISKLFTTFQIEVVDEAGVHGMVRFCVIYDTDGIAEAKRKLTELPVQDGSARATRDGYGGISIYMPKGSTPEMDAEEAAREREKSARADLARRMVEWAMTSEDVEIGPEVEDLARERRSPTYGHRVQQDGGDDLAHRFERFSALTPVGAYEARAALMQAAGRVAMYYPTKWTDDRLVAEYADELLATVDIFELAGFKLDEGDAWLIGRAREESDGGGAE